MTNILTVDKIHVYIEKSHILQGVSLNVSEGEVVGLIGRNGAGKTTTLKSIMGLMKVAEGKIVFKNSEITNKPSHIVARMGIGYAPEDRQIFSELTVEENIKLPLWVTGRNIKENEVLEDIYAVFPELKKYKTRKGTLISGGEQKMLSIARALATHPSILILDEPFEGLAPIVALRLLENIKKIRERFDIPILVTDSKAYYISKIADKVYVIERGSIIFEGKPEEIEKREDIKRVLHGLQ